MVTAPYASHPAALNSSRSPSRDPAPPAPLGLAVPLRRRGLAAPQRLCYRELLQKHRRRVITITGRVSFPLPRATHGNSSPDLHRAAALTRIHRCAPSASNWTTAGASRGGKNPRRPLTLSFLARQQATPSNHGE